MYFVCFTWPRDNYVNHFAAHNSQITGERNVLCAQIFHISFFFIFLLASAEMVWKYKRTNVSRENPQICFLRSFMCLCVWLTHIWVQIIIIFNQVSPSRVTRTILATDDRLKYEKQLHTDSRIYNKHSVISIATGRRWKKKMQKFCILLAVDGAMKRVRE